MKKNNNTEKVTFSNMMLHLFEGVFAGFASGVPFFQVKNLKGALSMKEIPFEKVRKDEQNKNALVRGIDDNNPYKMSLLGELVYLLCHRFTYLVGFIVGFALFFFIPAQNLVTQYPTAIYGGFIALSVGFVIFEIYTIIKNRKEKTHYIPSLLLFILTCCLCFILLKFAYGNVADIWADEKWQKLILIGGFFLSGFLLTFSGMSLTTLFFFSGLLISVSDVFNATLYSHTGILNCGLAIVSGIIGSFVALILLRHNSFVLEKSSINLGFYVMGIIFIALNKIKSPFVTGVSTIYAEWITIGTTIAVCLFVSLGLTIRNYGFMKKDKIDEELS